MKKVIMFSFTIAMILCLGVGFSFIGGSGAKDTRIIHADTGFDYTQDLPVAQIVISDNPYDVYYHGKVGANYVNAVGAECVIETQGSMISGITQRGLSGYRFSHFEIMKNDGLAHLFQVGLTLDTSYLNAYNEIHIIGIYVKICEVRVSVPTDSASQAMGEFIVSVEVAAGVYENVLSENGKFIFDSGTIIIIEARPFEFYKFDHFNQYKPSERMSTDPDSSDFTKLKVNVLIDRDFTIYFAKDAVTLQLNVPNGVVVNTKQVKLGDEVYLYSDNISKMHEIKDFKINGISVNHKDYVGDVKYSNGAATILITEDWLAGYGDVLEVEITTQIKEVYVIIGSIIAVVVPVMIIFLVLLLVQGKKAKIITRDVLKTEQSRKYRMNTGTYIEGIRSGEISGQVTDKDIKADLKKSQKGMTKE